jgi:hypothetical protein
LIKFFAKNKESLQQWSMLEFLHSGITKILLHKKQLPFVSLGFNHQQAKRNPAA